MHLFDDRRVVFRNPQMAERDWRDDVDFELDGPTGDATDQESRSALRNLAPGPRATDY